MDHIQSVSEQIRRHLFAVIALENTLLLGIYWFSTVYLNIAPLIVLACDIFLGALLSLLIANSTGKYVIQPLRAIWQTILHLSPSDQGGVSPPDLSKLSLGQELVASLAGQIYQLVNVAERSELTSKKESSDIHHNFIATSLPLPLFVLDDTETIQFANEAAAQYVGIKSAELIGKNVYMVLDMLFPSESTFDVWLQDAKQTAATATRTWERVRMAVGDNHPTRLFDLAAYYNKNNTQKIETMLVLFDHTNQYSQDDQAISFIALSVHELRTPLTILRGYIEVFEDELSDKVEPELLDFMKKMNATAQQLTAFVNNILNVARIDDDQLELKLQEEDWTTILKSAVEDISLRAQVRGITLECHLTTNLPPVGVDRLSIHEVINNIIDNAIKYSGSGKVIKIETHLGQDGLIETTFQDFGLGISSAVMPNLFTKFYRDHRNRAQIGGTGLGLYLSKAIITAHGGNLWVRSKEGEGSTFGFTLLPYAQLTDKTKQDGNQEITRGAHGWIKNHSMYRR